MSFPPPSLQHMAFSSPICSQNWYWLYQTLRGAFPASVLFIFSHPWLLIQYCKIPASETTQVCMLPSNWKWIHIPSAGICSTHCCAETPLSPMALLQPPWVCCLFQGTTSHSSTGPQMHSVGWGGSLISLSLCRSCFLSSLSEIHITVCLRSAARTQRSARFCKLHHSRGLSSQAMFW